jgi:hypothetical protein
MRLAVERGRITAAALVTALGLRSPRLREDDLVPLQASYFSTGGGESMLIYKDEQGDEERIF